MRVGLVTTWDTECGIATYSADLVQAAKGTIDYRVIAQYDKAHKVGPSDRPNVTYAWNRQNAGKQLKEVQEAIGADLKIVHFQHEFGLWPYTAGFYALCKSLQNRNIKVVITLHTPNLNDWVFDCSIFDAVVVHSRKAATIISNSDYIPHGIHAKPKAPTQKLTKNNEQMVLIPGFQGPGKGAEEIVSAIKNAKLPQNVKFQFVGKMPYDLLAKLSKQIELLGINASILPSFVSDDLLAAYFSEACLVLLGGPSPNDTPMSASGQLAKAISYWCPVFCKDVEIYREHDGAAILYKDAGQLAQMLTGFFARSRDQMLTSEAVASSRSWENVAFEHLDLYQTVCER